jgi:sigma-B regulation protein RsbU (phosphoserine phosphatase)
MRLGGLLSRTSIKWMMPPLLVLPVILVAAALTVLAYATGRRSVDELAGLNIDQIHGRIEDHLSQLLALPPAINELNKRLLRTGAMSLDDLDRDRLPVFETLNIFPAVSSVVIGTADGKSMSVIRYPGETTYRYSLKPLPNVEMEEHALDAAGQVGGQRLSAYAFDPTSRPWYKAAISAGGPTWGPVYVWVRDGKGVTLGVSYVEPFKDSSGKVAAVLNTELTLDDISAFLGKLRVGKTGKLFILERDGNLVASSTGLNCMTPDLGRMAAANAPDWIADASRELRKRRGDLSSISAPARARFEVAGEPMHVLVSPFQNHRGLDWLIVTLVPDSDFMADIRQNRIRSLGIGLVAVALMVGVSVLAIIAMMRPILKLVAHTRRVGAGHLDDRIHLTSSREMSQLSTAINEMVENLQDRIRLRQALAMAMDVQQHLLPRDTPRVEGLEIAARSQYCDETGGDYYDYLNFSDLSEGSVLIALGDVMGHGIGAAMLMASARGMLRSQVRVKGSLGELLTHVNDLLVIDTDGRRFMTMFLMVIDHGRGTLRYACAGHDPPVVYDPACDQFVEIGNEGGLPLGIIAGQTYSEGTFEKLRCGQVMVIGTDGVWEARNKAGEQFGYGRFREAIRESAGKSAGEIERHVFSRLLDFCDGEAFHDDVTYVVIKLDHPRHPQPGPV